MKINNHIILDFNKTKQVDTQTIQCDMNSRFVRVSLRHNNSPIDLSDVRVCIMAVKPDGKEIFNDCTVIDAQNGIAEFEITKQMGIVVGEVECQIKLFGKEKLLSSNIFNLSVNKSLYPDSQDSKDQLNTLVESLNRVDEWDDQFEQKYNGLEQEYAHDITEIKGLMAITPTVHDFIDETIIVENDIVDRVDGVEQEIVKTNAQLSDIIANNLTVSVKDYGALGDGVTDDTQAFINALNALKPNGGHLFIPKTPNFYRITNQIEITNEHGYVVVYGEGKSSHIKLTQKSTNGHLIGFIGTPENKLKGGCAKDLQLSTYLSETNQDDNCIGTMYSDNVVFDNIYVSTCTWKGITAQRGVTNFKVKNCYVENCKESGITVEFSDCGNIFIEDSTVRNIDKIGVNITNTGEESKMCNVFMTSVVVSECGSHNMSFSGVDNGHIDKSSTTHSKGGHGIQIYNSVNISIDKTEVKNNAYAGVNVQGSSNVTLYQTSSTYNSLDDNQQRGNVFVRQDSSNVKIIDSDISKGVRSFTSQVDETTLFNTIYKGTTNNPVTPLIREIDKTNSIALTKQGSWVDVNTTLYAPAQVRHRNGCVHIIGALTGGNISPDQSLALIPDTFKPPFNYQYTVKCIANGVVDVALIRCDKDGRIVIEKTPVGTTEIYLDVSYLL